MIKGQFIQKAKFTKQNFMALAACAFAAYYVISIYGSPPEAAGIESIERQIAQVQQSVIELESKPSVPLITDSWGRFLKLADRLGVFVTPEDSTDRPFYEGPLKSWNGTVTGDVRSVLISLVEGQRLLPLYLYSYDLKDGKLTVDFSVVGG